MFISFVQGAALSGLTSMTLEPRHWAYLDRVLLGMLRSLSGELRVKRGDEPDRNKQKKWQLKSCTCGGCERHPKDHHAVVIAVLWTCRAVEMVGVRH